MDFLGGKCSNCGTRISLAEKDLYAGFVGTVLEWGI